MASSTLLAVELHQQGSRASLPFPPEAVGAFSCRGVTVNPRSGRVMPKTNQDRGCVCASFAGDPKRALVCVFDGHGSKGELVSQYVLDHLPRHLAEHAALADDPCEALRSSFVAIDEALKVDKSISTKYSGTTAVVCLCLQDSDGGGLVIHTANAGDSRAVLLSSGQRCYTAIDLSEDQKPDGAVERERIVGAGGHVSEASATGAVARVWLDASQQAPGLAVARSIGDHVASSVGVFAEPEVTTRRVECRHGEGEASSHPVCLLLGSDGVFEFLGSQPAAEVVAPYLASSTGGCDATEACAKLVSAATAAWQQRAGDYCDDITAVVARVDALFGGGGSGGPPGPIDASGGAPVAATATASAAASAAASGQAASSAASCGQAAGASAAAGGVTGAVAASPAKKQKLSTGEPVAAAEAAAAGAVAEAAEEEAGETAEETAAAAAPPPRVLNL